MKYRLRISNALLIFFIITENLTMYYFFRIGLLTQGKNAWCLFLSSVLFGVVLLYKFYNTTNVADEVKPKKSAVFTYAILPVIFISGLVCLGFLYNALFSKVAISVRYSDIIPVIQVFCHRFVSGQYPYEDINFFGWTQQVNYLPMHWLPFTIAEVLKIDYRWIGFGVWCIAATLLFIRSLKITSIYLRSFTPFLLLASNFVLFYNNPNIIGITIEIMIAAYYMLFISGLNQQNGIIQGLFISFCLLSRYSLVLWLPLYVFVLFVSNNRKQLYLSFLTITIVATVTYVMPFLSRDWHLLYRGYKGYDDAAIYEWKRVQNEWGINNGKPLTLFSGTGFAYFIYTRFATLDILLRIKILQKIHLFCCIVVTVIMGVWYWLKKDKINYKIFLLDSFKIYLAVFLFLIQVPYPYLMITGNFVSIAIFCEQARYRVKLKK